ncbi:MAG: DUF805 domain-containing protein [Opitutales bacterium]|nr:DUF805 domain-containing protein [Opitutales bacterium]
MSNRPGIFSFKGRLGRGEFLAHIAVTIFVTVLGIPVLSFFSLLPGGAAAAIFYVFLALAFFWYILACMSKRCHDLGNPGIYMLIPFYGLDMFVGESELGDNDYGPNPTGADLTP